MDFGTNNTYKSAFENFETEIGDVLQTKFYPQVKIKKWDNEVNFSLRLIDDNSGFNILDSSKVKYVKDDIETHFYELEKGFEFEIILKSKPLTHLFSFTIQHKGLDFFYQRALTQEELDEGMTRDEKVVGSYAVYHKSKSNNNYQTGKAFHIYRPLARDANNVTRWCELLIKPEDNIATITIPQDFLDSAQYPISIDPDFGYTSLGASVYDAYSTRSLMNVLNTYTPGSGETITSYTLGCHSGGGAGTFQIVAYYDDDDEGLDTATRLNTAVNKAINSSSAAFETTSGVSHAMSAGHAHAVAMCTISGGNQIAVAYDDASGGTYRDEDNPLPAVFGMDSSRDFRISMYATYSSGAAPTNPLVKLSGTFASKPINFKSSGTFAEKTMMVKVGGTFV